MNSNRWMLPALLFLVIGLAVSCGGGDSSPGTSGASGTDMLPIPKVTPMPTVVGTTQMVVDAVSGEPIDATRVVTGAAPFDADIVVVAAQPAYQGYQYMLYWDPAVLALNSEVDLKPDELSMCATAASTDKSVAAGCVRVAGPTTFSGAVSRVTLHCVANGTSQLHLLASAERSGSYSTTLTSQGLTIGTALVDASITCSGVAPGG